MRNGRPCEDRPVITMSSSNHRPRAHRDCRKVINLARLAFFIALYRAMTSFASPAWGEPFIQSQRRRIMHQPRSHVQAHSGGVASLFAVDGPPFCTMPSPLPTSCSRKSL